MEYLQLLLKLKEFGQQVSPPTNYVLTGIGSTTIGLKADSVTGIVTHINVTGDLTKLRENDILGIGTEQVKVLNVEPKFSRIRILRAINGTGISHTVTSVLNLDPRTLRVNAGFNTTYEYRVNKQLYFNPVNAVAIGTALGVGVGSTVPLANPGGISEIFNPTRSIYIRDHGLETGDQLTYNTNVGAGLSVMLRYRSFNTDNNFRRWNSCFCSKNQQ